MRSLDLILWLLLTTGCGPMAAVPAGDEEDESAGASSGDAAIRCDGAIGTEPRLLVTDLADGWLFRGGDDLLHIERWGSVRRIDRCSGEAQVVAEVAGVESAALSGEVVYLVTRDDAGSTLLRLASTRGDEAGEVIAEVAEDARLVGHPRGLYVRASLEDGDFGIFVLDEERDALELLHRIEYRQGLHHAVDLVGASEVGLYVRVPAHGNLSPELVLLPFDGSQVSALAGTGGATSLAAVGPDLLTSRDPSGHSVVHDIVRLPIEGGDADVLFPADDDHTYMVMRVAASEAAVCWINYDAPPRCLPSAPGAPVRVMDDASATGDLVLADGVAYWLRASARGDDHELVAAGL